MCKGTQSDEEVQKMNKLIRTHNKRTSQRNDEPSIPYASKEARICLECPLPAKSCKPSVCQRYKDEMKKIKE